MSWLLAIVESYCYKWKLFLSKGVIRAQVQGNAQEEEGWYVDSTEGASGQLASGCHFTCVLNPRLDPGSTEGEGTQKTQGQPDMVATGSCLSLPSAHGPHLQNLKVPQLPVRKVNSCSQCEPRQGTWVLLSKDTRGNAPCLYSQWCVVSPEPTPEWLGGKLCPLGCLVVGLPAVSRGLWSSCYRTVSPLAGILPSRPLTLAVGKPGLSRAQTVQHILADPCV